MALSGLRDAPTDYDAAIGEANTGAEATGSLERRLRTSRFDATFSREESDGSSVGNEDATSDPVDGDDQSEPVVGVHDGDDDDGEADASEVDIDVGGYFTPPSVKASEDLQTSLILDRSLLDYR